MANSLIKTGIGKQFFGEQSYTKEDLDYFLENYTTFTEDQLGMEYPFDMKTLSVLSSNQEYTKLLYNGKEISVPTGLINDLLISNNNTYSAQKIEERLTDVINAIGGGSGSGSSDMWQKIYLNVVSGDILNIGVIGELTLEKTIIQVYKFIEGSQNIVEILKEFNNTDASNFNYDSEMVSFDGVMKIKDEYELKKSLNSDGLYETEVIDKDEFAELYNISMSNISGSNVVWNENDNKYWTVDTRGLTASIISYEYNVNYVNATKGVSSGKWYWEIRVDSTSSSKDVSVGVSIYGNSNRNNMKRYSGSGQKSRPATSYGDTFGVGDVISVALDMDLGTLEFFKNGVSQGVAFTDLLSLGTVYPVLTFGTNAGYTATVTANFGLSPFIYENVFKSLQGYLPYDDLYCLIKQNNQYYSIKPEFYDTALQQYNPLTTIDIDTDKFDISDLFKETTIDTETFKPIDKFNNFSLVTTGSVTIFNIKAIPTTKQLIVANDDIYTSVANNIDYFNLLSNVSENSSLKLALSIDSGATWKTWNATSLLFEDLDVKIPTTPYAQMTDDEKLQWDNAKEVISANGIDVATFNTLDFNLLNSKNIRFAYVIDRPSYSDVAETDQLNWKFDAKGSMKLMKSDEFDINVYENSIKIASLIDNPIIKANVIV